MLTPPELFPAQHQALEKLERNLRAHHVTSLMGRPGAGKTTILRVLHERIGGTYLTSQHFVEASANRHPLALDETVHAVLRDALSAHDSVIVDDFHLVAIVSCCAQGNPRLNFLAAALVPILQMAAQAGKRLVFGTEGIPVPGICERVPSAHIPPFVVDDYAMLCAAYLPAERARALDVKKIHRFAPNLNARQLRNTCNSLRDEPRLDTNRFIDYLREHHMASNVDLGEVQVVDLRTSRGWTTSSSPSRRMSFCHSRRPISPRSLASKRSGECCSRARREPERRRSDELWRTASRASSS